MPFFFNPFPLVSKGLQNVFGSFVDQAQETLVESTKKIANTMGEYTQSAIQNVQAIAQPVWESPAAQNMSEKAENALEYLEEMVQPTMESLSNFAQSTVEAWWKTVGPSYKEYCPSFIKGTWLCPDEPLHWCDVHIENIYLNNACKAGFSVAESIHEYAQDIAEALNVSPHTVYLGAAALVAVPTLGALAWNLYKKKSLKVEQSTSQSMSKIDATTQTLVDQFPDVKKTHKIGATTDAFATSNMINATKILTHVATQTTTENSKLTNSLATQTDLKTMQEFGTQTCCNVEEKPSSPIFWITSKAYIKPSNPVHKPESSKISRSEKNMIYVSDALKEKIAQAWLMQHGEEQVKKENARFLPPNLSHKILYNQLSSNNIDPVKHILGDRLNLSQDKYLKTDEQVQAFNEVIRELLPNQEPLALPKKKILKKR